MDNGGDFYVDLLYSRKVYLVQFCTLYFVREEILLCFWLLIQKNLHLVRRDKAF